MDARSRLIVALDVPTRQEALVLVQELRGVVAMFKVGLELIVGGGVPDVLAALAPDQRLFLDLKTPSDIPETVKRTVRSVASWPAIELLTLDVHTTAPAIRAAREGRGGKAHPKLIMVSWLSSMDASDLPGGDLDAHLRERASFARDQGCDGMVASGDAIALVRAVWPEAVIVSPGVRAAGAATDDHKRAAAPADAIRAGADYLVVGRPIRDAADRPRAAREFIVEIERGLADRRTPA
ncbi:MAG TPA: orotidine-5'-phosphate decarboxylase [Candidatus Polarisedimenticolaceae bacterium]|nr:orotidine-5'-phosphate decarboxylase [Candidatus Polarisedimenticolaceae bacterium]